MLKIDAAGLAALGAPNREGAAQIEEWLRNLLRPGTVQLPSGLVELRGSEPVVTTLGDLRKACGVAGETVKQGLRALEMDHWILLVDGAHTRFLGPPRFRTGVTKENFAGSVSRSVVVSIADGLSPLETIDYDRLRQGDAVTDGKRILALEPVALAWSANLKLARQQDRPLQTDQRFTLAAGSQVRESGRAAALLSDASVVFDGERQVRLEQPGELMRETGERFALPSNATVHLERSNLIRTNDGITGLLEIRLQAALPKGQFLDWGEESHWLARFRTGLPLVLVRRAVFAELEQVVDEHCSGVNPTPASIWRVVLGFHDCVLDGTIPYRAGKSTLQKSPGTLIDCLRTLAPADSLRERLAREYQFSVEFADVRSSPGGFASHYDRTLLRDIATNPEVNSELLSLTSRLPCWTQVGAYHRRDDVWPWEITREVYFTHVDLHFRQHAFPDL